MDSILTSIKKLLGIGEEYEQFDVDIIIHINSVFTILKRLGVGPEEGFRITGATEVWSDFLSEDDKHFDAVKTYVYQKVKLIFDPPDRTAVLDAYKAQIAEFEWTLNVEAESTN